MTPTKKIWVTHGARNQHTYAHTHTHTQQGNTHMMKTGWLKGYTR